MGAAERLDASADRLREGLHGGFAGARRQAYNARDHREHVLDAVAQLAAEKCASPLGPPMLGDFLADDTYADDRAVVVFDRIELLDPAAIDARMLGRFAFD